MTEGIPEKILEELIQRIPTHRLGEPSDITTTHVFLASDKTAYITNQILFVDENISVDA